MTLTITIPGRPPTPNARPSHWSVRARDTAQWKRTAWLAALAAKPRDWHPVTRARVDVEFVVPDNRRRDRDNLIASSKVLTDGLVLAGIIADDSHQVIVEQTFSIRVEKGRAATVYTVSEA